MYTTLQKFGLTYICFFHLTLCICVKFEPEKIGYPHFRKRWILPGCMFRICSVSKKNGFSIYTKSALFWQIIFIRLPNWCEFSPEMIQFYSTCLKLTASQNSASLEMWRINFLWQNFTRIQSFKVQTCEGSVYIHIHIHTKIHQFSYITKIIKSHLQFTTSSVHSTCCEFRCTFREIGPFLMIRN